MKNVENHFSRPSAVDEMDKKLARGLTEWEEDVIQKRFPQTGRVLDIGCGCGREAIHLAKKGYDVVAVDVSEPQIDRARENSRKMNVKIAFEKTDGLNLPPGDFDVIILWAQVLGNIEAKQDQLTLLCNCRKSLTDSGLISGSGHEKAFCQKASPKYTDENWLYPWGRGDLKYHLFTKETLEELFIQSEFHILETEVPISLPAIIHTAARKIA